LQPVGSVADDGTTPAPNSATHWPGESYLCGTVTLTGTWRSTVVHTVAPAAFAAYQQTWESV
jgi:hypothetical protein